MAPSDNSSEPRLFFSLWEQLDSAPRRYGKTAFDLTLLVLEDDGAVLTGSLAAASLALADAKAEGTGDWTPFDYKGLLCSLASDSSGSHRLLHLHPRTRSFSAGSEVEMRDLVAGATVHLAGPGAAPRLLLDCDRREERALAADAAVLHVGLCPSRGEPKADRTLQARFADFNCEDLVFKNDPVQILSTKVILSREHKDQSTLTQHVGPVAHYLRHSVKCVSYVGHFPPISTYGKFQMR